LCAYDIEIDENLKDDQAIRIIELLIDKYHFQDQNLDQENQIVINGVNYVDSAIQEDLKDIDNEEIVKILGVIRFVAKRRAKTGLEYMTIIHQYVRPRIDSGIRVL
jgi:transcription initiation factor IIE alpha subunit